MRIFRENALVTDQRALGDVLSVLTCRERYELLRAQVSLDALTEVNNRGHFEQALPQALRHALESERPLSLLMVDVDHFKPINDRAGHVEGDRVLRSVAGALKRSVRGSDVVCRYGGEEFGVILPETSLAAAESLANASSRPSRASVGGASATRSANPSRSRSASRLRLKRRRPKRY